jgi:mannose-6-phosphate isomerase-like protein (cupin superfamily)
MFPLGGYIDVTVINLEQRLATFTEHWQPRTVAEFNGHDIMVVKANGEFVWHKHDDSDDLFVVLWGPADNRTPER